jgi:hypothetical protein
MIKKNPQKLMLLLIISMISGLMFAQTSSMNDMVPIIKELTPKDDNTQQKKDKKQKDEFKVFAGVNFNNLNVSSEQYKSTMAVGWALGASYKRGKFFYWELGALYNNPVYNLTDATIPADSSSYLDGLFSVKRIDIPVTFGINFLSFTSRIVGLRVFVSAVPSFAIGVGGNDLNISMDNVNAFNFYGQAGVGLDVTFIFIEIGMNYGFQDLFQNYSPSNPYQAYINLGFRF